MEGQRQHHEVIRSDHHRGGNGAATGSVAKGNGIIMTDEQLETLRKQIALYAVICNKLAETHKNLTATKPQQDTLGGVRLGNTSVAWAPGHKFSSRPRWNPTPTQIQTLERIFNEGSGLPSKQKIKEIASQLSQHGQISETNVYNWFQNRRARSKRRKLQQAAAAVADAEDLEEMGDDGSDSIKSNNNGASKVEIEKANLEDLLLITHQQSPAASRVEDLCFQSPEICAELLHFVDSQNPEVESMFPSDGSLSHDTRNLGRKSFQDITRSSSGNRHSTGDSGS